MDTAQPGAGAAKTAPPKEAEKPKLEKALVAIGHTVVAGGGPIYGELAGKKVVVGHKRGKRHGPGEEVELPHDEVVRLRGTGALVDPEKALKPRGKSPILRR